ncbi:hypothetical protein HYU23_04420 [Candidatus Woesearchaeota archaeon]|nr:hypothetical protein [Candidatus Woesearchaeota archaeon]
MKKILVISIFILTLLIAGCSKANTTGYAVSDTNDLTSEQGSKITVNNYNTYIKQYNADLAVTNDLNSKWDGLVKSVVYITDIEKIAPQLEQTASQANVGFKDIRKHIEGFQKFIADNKEDLGKNNIDVSSMNKKLDSFKVHIQNRIIFMDSSTKNFIAQYESFGKDQETLNKLQNTLELLKIN